MFARVTAGGTSWAQPGLREVTCDERLLGREGRSWGSFAISMEQLGATMTSDRGKQTIRRLPDFPVAALARPGDPVAAPTLSFPPNTPSTWPDFGVQNGDGALFARFEELQEYVGWEPRDQEELRRVHSRLQPDFAGVVEDFYSEIARHQATLVVLGDSPLRPEILKRTLLTWLDELFTGEHDEAYVLRRWRVGLRHVEIGLEQTYTSAALSRLRQRLAESIERHCEPGAVSALLRSLHRVLDLDHMLIEEAYRYEWNRRQAELEKQHRAAEAERSREALQAVLRVAPCLIVIIDSAGTIRDFSPHAETLTGYQAAEVLGRDWFDLFIPEPELARQVREELARALVTPLSTGYTNKIIVRDGSERLLVWNSCPLVNEAGETVLLGVGQDITPLREAQKRALQTERLAAIGEMIAGLAHESRNALQRSQACLEMLAIEIHDRPSALDMVARIQSAQDALHALYEEVRDYAAPIRLRPAPHNLRRIVEDTWENLAVERQKHPATLRFASFEGIPRCQVDALALEQVFRNILENSLACGQAPVKIEVELHEVTLDRRPAYRVVFRDNGPGLTPESRARIFEPFFTTKTKGTGLGMAISRRLVEAHGGQIEVGQSPGPGTEILITLPVEGPRGEPA